MLERTALAMLLFFTSLGAGADQPRIVRLDPRLDALLPRDAAVEAVARGFTWLEGPVWSAAEGALFFSDIPGNAVHRWSPGGGARLFLRPSGYTGSSTFTGREPGSNGLTLDAQGRLVLAEHGDRRIGRLERDGKKTTLADRFQGKRLNSPNDLVYRSNGDLYFTDPPFGLPEAFDDPGKELPFSGVFRLSAAGALSLVTGELRAPNGIAFSPDERTLYVSNADAKRAIWMAYPVSADGSAGAGRVFFDATAWARPGTGNPDGMKVDQGGNLFAAGPGGLHVFSPGGAHLGFIEIAGATANCAFGEDGSTLFIAAGSAIYRVRTTTRGAALPGPR